MSSWGKVRGTQVKTRVTAIGTLLAGSLVAGVVAGTSSFGAAPASSSLDGTVPDEAVASSGLAPRDPSFGAYHGPLYAIGDTTLRSARPCLTRHGVEVYASNEMTAARAFYELAQRAKSLPERILIEVGVKGGIVDGDIDRIMTVLGPRRLVLWSTIQIEKTHSFNYEDRSNFSIDQAINRYPNARILDWNHLTAKHPDWVQWDKVHVSDAGCRAYARKVINGLRHPTS